jgi:hypothetical protein
LKVLNLQIAQVKDLPQNPKARGRSPRSMGVNNIRNSALYARSEYGAGGGTKYNRRSAQENLVAEAADFFPLFGCRGRRGGGDTADLH